MNEPAFADRICRVLDEELDRLPERIDHRLAAVRESALARMPATAVQGRTAARRQVARQRPAAIRPAARAGATWLRWLPVPLATVLFAISLFGVWHWSELRRAQDLAALDVAILADDVPLSAYADKGFGVFLRNTRR